MHDPLNVFKANEDKKLQLQNQNPVKRSWLWAVHIMLKWCSVCWVLTVARLPHCWTTTTTKRVWKHVVKAAVQILYRSKSTALLWWDNTHRDSHFSSSGYFNVHWTLLLYFNFFLNFTTKYDITDNEVVLFQDLKDKIAALLMRLMFSSSLKGKHSATFYANY